MNKNSVLKKLAKKLPEGSIYSLDQQEKIEVIPSGISTIDFASGIGGFARGIQHMVFGPASAGKSAMILQAIGNYQKTDPESLCAVIDLEKSMTPEWAAKFGIDNERLVIIRPSTTEEMITMTMAAIEADAFDIIMVDSLGAGILQTELDNDKNKVAGSAGSITRMVKAINASFINLERRNRVARENGDDESIVPAVILINQVRVNMNSMYGEDTYSGGKALSHMMGMIIHLRVSKAAADKVMGTVDGSQLRVGWLCNATFEKNKLAVPGKSAGYVFVFKECEEHPFGIDNARSIADLATSTGVARVEGRTIYYPTPSGEEVKVVGRAKFNEAIRKDEELMNFIAEEISRIMSDGVEDNDFQTIKGLNGDADD